MRLAVQRVAAGKILPKMAVEVATVRLLMDMIKAVERLTVEPVGIAIN
jgi:hypothetical protein